MWRCRWRRSMNCRSSGRAWPSLNTRSTATANVLARSATGRLAAAGASIGSRPWAAIKPIISSNVPCSSAGDGCSNSFVDAKTRFSWASSSGSIVPSDPAAPRRMVTNACNDVSVAGTGGRRCPKTRLNAFIEPSSTFDRRESMNDASGAPGRRSAAAARALETFARTCGKYPRPLANSRRSRLFHNPRPVPLLLKSRDNRGDEGS